MTALSCVNTHFDPKSPLAAYRAEMVGDVAELMAEGMDSDAAWLQVATAKIAELKTERARIERVVADAYDQAQGLEKPAEKAPAAEPETAAQRRLKAEVADARRAEAEAALEQTAPVATHKDPGEPAEPVTPAVVREAIKTEAATPAATPPTLTPKAQAVKEALAGRKGEWRPSAAEVGKVVADATPYGKQYTGTEGNRQKARILTGLQGLGLKPREAQSVLDRAMTTEAQRRLTTMRFILAGDVRDAAEALGYTRPADAPAKRDEYPLGKTDREDRFFGTRVRVLPELKGDTAWEGTIQMTLNGGRLFSVKRADNDNGSFRISGDRLEILEVKDAEKADTKPKEPTKAPASINMLPLPERWDALVAHTKQDGGDPDKGQRSYRALTQFIGGFEEKPMEVWDRWSTALGSTGLVDLTGPQVLKWLESNLPTVLDGYIRSLPGNTLSVNAGDARYWQNALAEIERRTPDHNRYVDKLEKQALDVERLGGSAEKVAEARKTIDGVKRAFNRNERDVQQGLAMAERKEKEQADQRAADEAAKYKPFDAKELSKKPTSASMSGWFTATYEGKTVWTQGTVLDLSGEPPHMQGYADRMSPDRNKDGKLDVSRVIPRQKGPEAVPFGYYDGEYGKAAKNGVVYLEADGELVGVDARFFRYFASKFKGASYFASPNGGVLTVQQGGKTVGVIMPIKLGTDAQPAPSVAELRAKIGAPAAPAAAKPADSYPITAAGAVEAFNDDNAPQAMQIVAKLKIDALQEVGAAIGFRPQVNETAKAFRERLGGVADKLTKTAREKAARQKALYDKLIDRAMAYDRAADHAERARVNGVPDDSTAYDSFYTPMGGGETQMMRIPAMLDKLAADVDSLRNDPEWAEVAPMVSSKRPRVFEHKPASSTAPEKTTPAAEGGSSLDYVVDGVKEQAAGRQAAKERAAEAPKAEQAPAEQAAAILNAAAEPPKGAERLSVIKDVKAGAITPEEVAAAFPPAGEVADEAGNVSIVGKSDAAIARDALAQVKPAAEEVAALEAEYGATSGTTPFHERLAQDVADYITKGAEAIGAAIRGIVGKVAKVVLSIAVVFNVAGLNPQFSSESYARTVAAMPKTVTVTETVQFRQAGKADLNGRELSPAASKVVNWIGAQNRPSEVSLVLDPGTGRMYVLRGGKIEADAPALFGKQGVQAITDQALNASVDETTDDLKMTPAGRFPLTMQQDSNYGSRLDFLRSGASPYAIHRVYLGDPKERRQQRLDSATAGDNGVSFGCVNVSNEFYDKTLMRFNYNGDAYAYLIPSDPAQLDALVPMPEPLTTTRTSTYMDGGQQAGEQQRMGGDLGLVERRRQQATSARRRLIDGPGPQDDGDARMVVIEKSEDGAVKFNTRAEEPISLSKRVDAMKGGAQNAKDGQVDASPQAQRKVEELARAVRRARRLPDGAAAGGTNPVHPYEPRVAPGDAGLAQIAAAVGGRVQWFDLKGDLDPAQRRAYGFFDGANLGDTIYLKSTGVARPHLAILGHEFGHRLKAERPDLYEKLLDAITPYVNEGRYDMAFRHEAVAKDLKDEAKIQEEFVGEIFSDGFMDKGFWRAVGQSNPKLLAQIGRFIVKMINQIKAALGYRNVTTAYLKDFNRVMEIAGEIAGEFGQAIPASGEVKFNTAGVTTAQDLVDSKGGVFDFNRLGETKQDRIRTVTDGARPFWLGALTRDQIADVYGAEIPPVKDYDSLTRAMENERAKMAGDADELYNEWAKLDPDVNDRLARIMLDATVHQVHPDGAFNQTRENNEERKRVHGNISTQFKLLPKEAQAMYGKVRDFHLGTLTKLRDSLMDRVKRQVENGNARAAALTSIRMQFDKYLENGPYFPLSRFGDFLVVATRAEDGERVVASYETAGEQQGAARKLEADGFTVKLKTAKSYSRQTDGAAGKFIASVLGTVDALDMDDAMLSGTTANLKSQLLDDINQMFIQALPDLSYRKHFMHRKGTAGFSSDVMRGFASSAFHSASHIARLNHGDKMTFALQDAFKAIEASDSGDFNLHSQVLNELTKRHDAAMNPNTHPIAAMLNQVGFVMYLGLSPAAGLVNMLQTVMVTMPHLGARYGFGKANGSLAAAYKDILAAPVNAKNGWNAAQSSKLSTEERKVMSDLQDEGVIDLTQAHDLAAATSLDTGNVARSKAAFAMSKAMKIVGWTFHIPEVMNRQVTALSAYRLEMEKSGDQDAAKEAAREAIKRTHFDYSASNRARYMQGNVARVLLQFKQYSQNMTYLLGRAAHQALKGESPEVRAIARRQLVATLGVTFGMAGTLGLPGLGGAMGLIGVMVGALDDDDKPWDWKVEFRNLAADTFGKEAGEVLAHGIPRALMPWDISNRVGMGDMWWRSSNQEGQNPREAFASDMQNILGPSAGTVLGLYTAADQMARGNWSKAVEGMVPKALRDPLKAIREGSEGVTNYNGEPLMDVTGAEVAGRLLGFAPARASEMYEARGAVKNAETALNEKRQSLLSQTVKARMDGDTEKVHDLQQEINAFNQRNPDFKITLDSILKSMQAKRRNAAETQDGIRLPKGKNDLREIGRFAEIE